MTQPRRSPSQFPPALQVTSLAREPEPLPRGAAVRSERMLALPANAVRLVVTGEWSEAGKRLYRRADTGERLTWRDAPVGAVGHCELGRPALIKAADGCTVVLGVANDNGRAR